MDLAGKVLAERYRLEGLLAEGGMGQVWIARHLTLDIPVAVKIMATSAVANDAMKARFDREAKACAQLRSPHVVRVYDYGLEDDVPFLVMELLEGEDLTALCKRRSKLPLAEACGLIQQAAKGIAAANEAGIVHRDVKPSNLMIANLGEEQVLKVLDFGIAKTFEGPKMTKTNIVLGSPYYMSPEQVLGQQVDRRSDVWSLGVVAYLLITGELPFRGSTAIDVAEKIRTGKRKHPSALMATLGVEVDRFFEKALAVDRERRFGTTTELAAELERVTLEEAKRLAAVDAEALDRRSNPDEATTRPEGLKRVKPHVPLPDAHGPDSITTADAAAPAAAARALAAALEEVSEVEDPPTAFIPEKRTRASTVKMPDAAERARVPVPGAPKLPPSLAPGAGPVGSYGTQLMLPSVTPTQEQISKLRSTAVMPEARAIQLASASAPHPVIERAPRAIGQSELPETKRAPVVSRAPTVAIIMAIVLLLVIVVLLLWLAT